MNILAFIPARGGSKGIQRKNLYPLNGKPLISYTLDTVKNLGNRVIPFVSTDDEEILNYCISEGFESKYLRPTKLATDSSPMIDALLHGVAWYENENRVTIDSVILLQPTSPIRFEFEINNAITYFIENNLDSLVGVCRMKEHPFECIEDLASGWNFLRKPTVNATRRQDYKGRYFFLDGSLYIAKKEFLLKNLGFIKEGETHLFEVSTPYAIDIDDMEDMQLAEFVLKYKYKTEDKT